MSQPPPPGYLDIATKIFTILVPLKRSPLFIRGIEGERRKLVYARKCLKPVSNFWRLIMKSYGVYLGFASQKQPRFATLTKNHIFAKLLR